jgi:RNA polymerase sigma-70 factor, ECF subfamily
MNATDPELLERALDGEEQAFTALYRRRQGGVYRFALQMTGSVEIAEDVTQETFLALLTHGSRYDTARGSVAAFLYGIARNLVLRRLDERPAVELEESAGEDDLLEDLTRRESIERVRCAVLSLPPVYREVVVLCDLQDSSYEEAAAALDCPVGTVRSRLNRGSSMLARKLRGAATCGSAP